MSEVLIIDDDEMFCDLLARTLKKIGHRIKIEHAQAAGLRRAQTGRFDTVFLDVRLPDGSGLDILPKLRSADSAPEVIIMTGVGDPDGAELAITSGAWDYIEKGSSINSFILPLKRALQYRHERTGHTLLTALKRDEIVGSSQGITPSIDGVAKASSTDINVLITGETGTGKELFARAIHENSDRKTGNFVVVDCAALPESLVESLLFGYKKGAFTGAAADRLGLVKQADGGTLFLDEVAEMPLSLQKAFLRVLQEFSFRPVGGESEVQSQFRLIAATHQNLDQMMEEGAFRKDLLYRLRSFTIELPALRHRREDIKAICLHHTPRICEQYDIESKGVSPEFLVALTDHDWPGNVRELVHVLERAITSARFDPVLHPLHLPTKLRVSQLRKTVGKNKSNDVVSPNSVEKSSSFLTYKEFRDKVVGDVEKKYLQNLLTLTNSDIKAATELAELSRSRLYELLKKRGISLH